MRKLLYLTAILIQFGLQAKAQVPDIIRTPITPASGASRNNRASVDANLYVNQSLRIPRASAFTLNGAKDSIGYIMYNTTTNRIGVYKGSSVWDTYIVGIDVIAIGDARYAPIATEGYLKRDASNADRNLNFGTYTLTSGGLISPTLTSPTALTVRATNGILGLYGETVLINSGAGVLALVGTEIDFGSHSRFLTRVYSEYAPTNDLDLIRRMDGDTRYSPKNPPYGTIYSNSNFTSLTDFTNNGATASVSGGHLLINGIGPDYTHSLDYNYNSMLPNWTMTTRLIVPTITSTSVVGIGIRSTNSTNPHSIAMAVDLSNRPTAGRLLILYGSSLSNTVISTSNLTFAAGDTLDVIFTRSDFINWSARVVNKSTPNTNDIIATYNSETGSAGIGQTENTGRFAIFANCVDVITYLSLQVNSATSKNTDLAVVSDSKMGGAGATTYMQTTSGRLSLLNNTIHLSGGGDGTSDIISRLPEIVALNPKIVFLDIGRNDLALYGGTVSSVIANIGTIYNTLTAAGIVVWVMNGEYETVYNTGTLSAAIATAYPNNYINSYEATKSSGAASLASDGVHLSDIGQEYLYNYLLKQNKVNVKTYTAAKNASVYNPVSYGTVQTYGGLINMSNATSNVLAFRNVGSAIPSVLNRSLGTKISFFANTLDATNSEYAMGVASSTLWFSVPQTSRRFEWYGAGSLSATLTGTGNFTVPGSLTAGTTITGSSTVQGSAIISTGGQITTSSGSSNNLALGAAGLGNPGQTTKSTGEKITLFNAISGAQTNYAIGVNTQKLWMGVPTSSGGFSWYANTTEITTLTGAGNLATIGTITGSIAALGTTATTFLTHTAGLIQSRTAAQVRTDIGAGTGSGTVASVSVVTANGVSGSVATSTTTPAITLTLGAITPTSTNGVSAATMAFNDATSSIQGQLNGKQATLVSGTNIKTVNGTSLLGSGDVPVGVTSITPGYGHTSSTPITTSGTITVDSTVFNTRTTQQTISGAKLFTRPLDVSNNAGAGGITLNQFGSAFGRTVITNNYTAGNGGTTIFSFRGSSGTVGGIEIYDVNGSTPTLLAALNGVTGAFGILGNVYPLNPAATVGTLASPYGNLYANQGTFNNQLTVGPGGSLRVGAGGGGFTSINALTLGSSSFAQSLLPVNGFVPVVTGAQDFNGLTAPQAVVTSYTANSDGFFRVEGYVNITAISTDVLKMQVTYTDETSVVRTQDLYQAGATSSLLSATGNYSLGLGGLIKALSGSTITVKTILSVSGGTIAYNTAATITQLR